MKPIFSFLRRKEEKEEPVDRRNLTGEVNVRIGKAELWCARIGSVVIAVILWLIVMATDGINSTGVFEGIPVRIENESAYSVLSGDGMTVDVTVSGKRSVMNKLTSADFDAYVSIGAEAGAGKESYEIHISVPQGLTMTGTSLSKLMIYLDSTISVSVPVSVKLADYILEDDYELGKSSITTNLSAVKVTGPESLLKTVESAQVSLSLGRIDRTVTCTAPITVLDGNGQEVASNYLRLSDTEATVTVPVYKYRTVELKTTCKYGYFNEGNVSVNVIPSSIRIKGEADAVDAVSWSYTLDEKQMTGDCTYNVTLNLPGGVTEVSGTSEIRIEVKHIGTVTRKLTVSRFIATNPAGLTYEFEQGAIAVTVRGSEALLKYMTDESVTVSVDLTSVKPGSGTVSLPAEIILDDYYLGSVYEIGTYSLSVKVE